MARQEARRHGGAMRAITGGAIVTALCIGGAVLGNVVQRVTGETEELDPLLLATLALNILLILAGRHRQRAIDGAQQRVADPTACDPLTGLRNRRALVEDGTALLAEAGLRGRGIALFVIDIDHFTAVNDLHGHAAGDALLCRLGEQIGAALPSAGLAARIGGDAFACAFAIDPAQPGGAARIADRIVSRLAQPVRVDGLALHVSASLGIAQSDADCATIAALLRAADIAMHAAKRGGRNRCVRFDRSMERALQTRDALESGLRAAIPGGGIVPYFEQQIDLATGRLSGFEVLARWEHPERGLILPDLFIPIAEDIGLIAELSLSIMHQAFTAARDWDTGLTLSVNISPWQLRDAWLPQKIIKTLTETGFPASRLEIEITERALIDNLALAQSIVGSLKNQGIRIALDDFGTGYSSLAHLRALRFDRIKIDRSFIMSIAADPESAAIVKAIASLGESLNLPITAEGIEDAAVEERLRAIGCTKGQGYLYGRPMSVANVRRLLAEKRLLVIPPPRDVALVDGRRLTG